MSGPKKVYAAIAAVAGAMSQRGIVKGQQNTQQKFMFRGIDDVMNALSAELVAAGLLIMPRVMSHKQVERTSKNGGAIFYTILEVEYDFVAVEDGSIHVVRFYGEGMDSADKSTSKAASAAYKYACIQTFCIPTEGLLDDADFHTHEVVTNLPQQGQQQTQGQARQQQAGPATEPKQSYIAFVGMLTTAAKQGNEHFVKVWQSNAGEFRDKVSADKAKMDEFKKLCDKADHAEGNDNKQPAKGAA